MSTKVPTADMIELKSLFGPLFDEYFNGATQVVSKSSAIMWLFCIVINIIKPDSTSSTLTLATTVTVDGNFDLIETNLFDYETPLCEKFKEFNYLLKIDPDVLTNDIVGFKTYDEYKDDWIYEWNKNVPWVHEKPWTENGVWKEPSLVKHYLGSTLRYQDLEWYDALKDSELKEEALRNKAIMEGLINEDVESNNEGWKSWDDFESTNSDCNEWECENEHEDDVRHELCGNETNKLTVCNIRRFEMIKYSFGQDEEYAVVKENENEDLMNTSEDTCRAYQEIFRVMDEGWMVTRAE
ncbi:hypothetical protein Tco_1203287 [Tanacetum coccineum]